MRKLTVPIVAAVAALALSACGGGSSKAGASASATTTTTTAGGRFQSAAFTTCLKQHGVTLPQAFAGRGPGRLGGSGPRGGSGRRGFFGGGPGLTQKQRDAFSACRSKLPNGGQFGRGFAGGANAAALRAYVSCLGDHGVKVPKPATTSTPASRPESRPARFVTPLAGLRRDPKFAAANKICRSLLPAPGAPPTTSAAG